MKGTKAVILRGFRDAKLNTVLVAGLAVLALAAPVSLPEARASNIDAATPESLSFEVLRDGSQIGRHRISFQEVGDELHVDIAIDLEVNLAFITLFRYEHRNKEVWRDGRLISLESRTNDDGKEYSVSARATDEGLLVEGSSGSFLAPGDILPTSYWNKATVDQDVLLDTQRGGLLEVSAKAKGQDDIWADEKRLQAKRFDLDGDLDADLWYAPDGEWMKIAFTVRGAAIDYVPVGPHRGLRQHQQSSLR